LSGFRRELEPLGGVNVHEGGATKNSKIREVWVTSSERGKGDDGSFLGPRSVANVDHGEEGKSPKAIRKRS